MVTLQGCHKEITPAVYYEKRTMLSLYLRIGLTDRWNMAIDYYKSSYSKEKPK